MHLCVSMLKLNFQKKNYMGRFGKKFRIHLNHPICNHLTNKKYSSAENFPSRLKIFIFFLVLSRVAIYISTSHLKIPSKIAQWLERWSCKPEFSGSSPRNS